MKFNDNEYDLKNQLTGLSIFYINYYLKNKGWYTIRQIQDKALILNHKNHSEELILPIKKELGDFAIRMAELFKNLSLLENKKIESLIDDIKMLEYRIK